MTTGFADRRPPERLRFWQGQSLASGDLNHVVDQAATRKAWHTRSLHDAFGIVAGLEVADVPNSDPASVAVHPGVACDCFGRTLILAESRIVALPTAANGDVSAMVLVLTASAPASCKCALGRGASPVSLSWVPARRMTPAAGVPLMQYQAGIPPEPGGMPVRRRVRPDASPVIGFGATLPGATPWRQWRQAFTYGIELEVETSAFGFSRAPVYMAHLVYPDPRSLGSFTIHFDQIVRASKSGFIYRVRLIETEEPPPLDYVVLLAQRDVSMTWIGVEPFDAETIDFVPTAEGG